MQVARSQHFGCEHAANLIRIHAAYQSVINNGSGMHDTFERWQCLAYFCQQGGNGFFVGNVAGSGMNLDALLFQPGNRVLGHNRGRAAAADQDQMASPFTGEPFGGSQAETAQASGHQIGTIGGKFQLLLHSWSRRMNAVDTVAIGDDDFADLPRLLHVAEGVDNIFRLEHMVRQRMEYTFGKQRHHFGKQAAGKVRARLHQLVGIDAEVADVVAERAQADLGIFVEIPLAKFQESAERLQHAEVAVDGFAGEGVEHDIHAFAASLGQDFIGKSQ